MTSISNQMNLAQWLESPTLEDLLESTTISDLAPPSQDIITIPSNATVAQAIEILSSHRILSAPLEAPPEMQKEKKSYLGFVDMFDLVTFALNSCTQEKQTPHGKLQVWSQDLQSMLVKAKTFEDRLVRDIVNLSHYNPFCTVSPSAKLPQLLFIFQKGLHRVAVLDESTGKIQSIISQSNVIDFLAKNINHLGKLGHSPIEELNLGQKARIITVMPQARAVHAFYQMLQRHVSAVAVVDKQGILAANLSISDLRGLGRENFSYLMLPVLEYIQRQVYQKKVVPPLTVVPSTTFETVVLKLAATRAHRLWVVDQNGCPTGVISLTDVMKLLDLRCYVKETDAID